MPKVTYEGAFTGTGKGLNYIGSYVYAFSGEVVITSSGNPQTLLLFNTGAESIKARLTYCVNDLNLGDGNNIGYSVKLNGETIITVQDSSGEARSLGTLATPMDFIIPPNSRIEVLGITDDSSDLDVSAVLLGKILE